jgi:hypothetical protein
MLVRYEQVSFKDVEQHDVADVAGPDGGRQQQRQQHWPIAAADEERKRRRRPGDRRLRTALNRENRV